MRKPMLMLALLTVVLAILITIIYNYVILPGVKETYRELSKPDTTVMIHDGRKDTIIKK